MNISILGDSISTYEGFVPSDYRVYYRGSRLLNNNLSSPSDTWWAQVIHHLHGTLCINNSYSGCKVSGSSFPAACSNARIENLHHISKPDLILIYLGLNDFGFNVPIRNKNTFISRPDPSYFFDAYHLMLKHIRHCYPDSKVICGSLLKTYIRDDMNWNFDADFHTLHKLESYNSVIEYACRKHHALFANLGENGSAFYETLDGAHPTHIGHRQLARYWISALDHMSL